MIVNVTTSPLLHRNVSFRRSNIPTTATPFLILSSHSDKKILNLFSQISLNPIQNVFLWCLCTYYLHVCESMSMCVRVKERERERETDRQRRRERERVYLSVFLMCVCERLCVSVSTCLSMCMCEGVCVYERVSLS